MGKYLVEVRETARKELRQIYKSGNKADIKRVEKIFSELEEHPTTGIGNPKQLKHELAGYWSRRINQKDRLIYSIDDKKVIVIVVSARGHYDDK